MKVLIDHYASRMKICEIEKIEMGNKQYNTKKWVDDHASKIKQIVEIERHAQ